jgi:hypothetical protein
MYHNRFRKIIKKTGAFGEQSGYKLLVIYVVILPLK